ncbi:MAG: hypothetical protein MUF50_04540 [Planctomycetes bacterium]|jgi:hypothetical protein|nr:hypothetical protein [Planctomycetota bacterium]
MITKCLNGGDAILLQGETPDEMRHLNYALHAAMAISTPNEERGLIHDNWITKVIKEKLGLCGQFKVIGPFKVALC